MGSTLPSPVRSRGLGVLPRSPRLFRADGLNHGVVAQPRCPAAMPFLRTGQASVRQAAGLNAGRDGGPQHSHWQDRYAFNPQTAGLPFNVTVNAVDQYWNVVASTDEIAITSSDATATLPANTTLFNGSKTFSVTFNTASPPDFTVTATDVTDGTKTANTGSPTTVQQ